MAKNGLAPLGTFFSAMKRYGGITYKELAALVLTEKPRAKGVSPASRVNDRTWISRYLVHAPADAIKSSYFISCEKCAMRVVSRLKQRMRDQKIMDFVIRKTGNDEAESLLACNQNVRPFLNMLARLFREDGGPLEERMEAAMVLLVSAAIYADVPKALSRAMHFIEDTRGPSTSVSLTTPRIIRHASVRETPSMREPLMLGVVRIKDGCIADAPRWFDAMRASEIEVGTFSTRPGDLSDVDADVSRHHARIWHDGDSWYVEGLGSTNGTTLISGLDGSRRVVEPPADEREGWTGAPVMLKPADELVFGNSTRYLVIAGMRAPKQALTSTPPRG